MPERIQLSRSKGSKRPENTVSVARPSMWGNPFQVRLRDDYTAADAVRDFVRYLARDPSVRFAETIHGLPPTREVIRRELAGKNLGCWCELGEPCHADVLLTIANEPDAAKGHLP